MAGSNILQSYLIKLSASVDRTAFDGFMRSVASGISTVAKFGAATVGAFAVVQAGLMKLASSESALDNLSGRVGATVEEIERLGYVASQSGSSTGAMQSALEGLSSKAGQAAMGMAGAQKAFQSIGLNIRDSSGQIKGATALLDDLGGALSGRDRNFQLAALDRLGIDRTLLKSITGDVSGLREEFDEMARTAGVDFAKTSKAASELTDEVGKTGTFIRLTHKVLGADLMGDTANWLRRLRGWIRENSKEIQEAIGTTVKLIQAAGIFVGGTLKRIGEGIAFLHKKTDGLSTAFLALAGVVAVLGWPVTLIAAGIAAVVLLVDDLMTALEGGKTLIDWSPWLENIRAAGRWMDELAGKVKEELLVALKDLKGWLDDIAKDLGLEDLNQAFEVIKGALPGILKDLGELAAYLAGKAWSAVKGAFSQLGDAIRTVLRVLMRFGRFVKNVFTGNLSEAFKDIKGIVEEVGGYIERTFGRVKDAVIGVLGVIGDAIGKARELLGLGKSAEDREMSEREKAKDAELKAALTPTYSRPPAGGGTTGRIPVTTIGSQMLKTGPALPANSNPYYQNFRESPKVEVNQTNHIEIAGMQNAQEIGGEVTRSLDKVNRDMGDKYRYSVGAM